MHFKKDIILSLPDFCIWVTHRIWMPLSYDVDDSSSCCYQHIQGHSLCFISAGSGRHCWLTMLQEKTARGGVVGVRGRWSHGIHYSSYKALQWMATGSLCHCLELCKIPQWNSSATHSRWPPRAEVGGYAPSSCATAAGQGPGPQWTAFVAIVFCWGQTVWGGFIFRTTALCMYRSADCSGCPVCWNDQLLWCLLDVMGSFIAAILQRGWGEVDLGNTSAVVRNPFLLSFLAQLLIEWRARKIPSYFRSIMFPKFLNFSS